MQVELQLPSGVRWEGKGIESGGATAALTLRDRPRLRLSASAGCCDVARDEGLELEQSIDAAVRIVFDALCETRLKAEMLSSKTKPSSASMSKNTLQSMQSMSTSASMSSTDISPTQQGNDISPATGSGASSTSLVPSSSTSTSSSTNARRRKSQKNKAGVAASGSVEKTQTSASTSTSKSGSKKKSVRDAASNLIKEHARVMYFIAPAFAMLRFFLLIFFEGRTPGAAAPALLPHELLQANLNSNSASVNVNGDKSANASSYAERDTEKESNLLMSMVLSYVTAAVALSVRRTTDTGIDSKITLD